MDKEKRHPLLAQVVLYVDLGKKKINEKDISQ
jgi:hypothetical protein